jgi:hypothetical protein
MSHSRFSNTELKARLIRMYGPTGKPTHNWVPPIARSSVQLRSHQLTGVYGFTDT